MADYTPSAGNVFKDLGLPSPNERLAKAKLAYKINRLIADQEMTQKDAAHFLGISRSKMTALRNGRLKNFTINHLASLFRSVNSDLQKQQGQ
ncbi:XRE family transcriptional regulator [Candidatus Poribacteria bacterium]|nr:XRE family transcriptional regulator [Candidatus Poribacteria bacterium]